MVAGTSTFRVVASSVSQGAKVKVTKSVKVFHVGKFKQGLDLEGRVGTVVENVQLFEGQQLSANLPWK